MRHMTSPWAAAASMAATLLTAAPAGAGQDEPALSKASLDYTVSSICTLTTPSGSSSVPCSSTLWNVTLEPGWSATVSSTWSWHYIDDGLPVDRAFLPGPSVSMRPVSHESAGLYVETLPTCLRGSPCIVPNLSGSRGFFPVFESNNSVPEDITGSRTISVTATWPATIQPADYTWAGQVGFFHPGYPYTTVNSAPPIPEPSTWVLLGVPLAALVLFRRRR